MTLLDLSPVEQRTLSDEAAERLRAAIRNGTNANPTYATMKALSDYLTAVTVDG